MVFLYFIVSPLFLNRFWRSFFYPYYFSTLFSFLSIVYDKSTLSFFHFIIFPSFLNGFRRSFFCFFLKLIFHFTPTTFYWTTRWVKKTTLGGVVGQNLQLRSSCHTERISVRLLSDILICDFDFCRRFYFLLLVFFWKIFFWNWKYFLILPPPLFESDLLIIERYK